ncbi:hypothetical protein L208DRAFT_1529184 [Tricholoma matsutake]|nr:hypothetical protein L208DRAFT_1529184 [Tricholoma matsutake 945]
MKPDRVLNEIDSNASVPPPITTTAPLPMQCQGAAFRWELGSPYMTYPFSMHDPALRITPGYNLIWIESQHSIVHVWSILCSGISPTTSGQCLACQSMRPLVTAIEDHARKPVTRLDHTTMSSIQHNEKLKEVQQELQDVTLQLNDSKSLSRLCVHQETWKNLLDLLGTHDIPGLHRIFKNAKRRNWSTEQLYKKMRMALAGDYHPQSYSDLEIELATVIYELGGGAALHALHNSPFAFPSRKTIFEHRREFRLCITVGAVQMTDILANIETMFANVKPDHRTIGITLSMDEVTSDARLCYLTMTDEIAGLCEHATAELLLSVKMGTDLTVVRAVCQAVRKGKIHIGQEVFIAAFSHNDEEGRC